MVDAVLVRFRLDIALATDQRVSHRPDQFVDIDRSIAVVIAVDADRETAVSERDVDHLRQLGDIDVFVVVAVAGAARHAAVSRRRAGTDEQREQHTAEMA